MKERNRERRRILNSIPPCVYVFISPSLFFLTPYLSLSFSLVPFMHAGPLILYRSRQDPTEMHPGNLHTRSSGISTSLAGLLHLTFAAIDPLVYSLMCHSFQGRIFFLVINPLYNILHLPFKIINSTLKPLFLKVFLHKVSSYNWQVILLSLRLVPDSLYIDTKKWWRQSTPILFYRKYFENFYLHFPVAAIERVKFWYSPEWKNALVNRGISLAKSRVRCVLEQKKRRSFHRNNGNHVNLFA